jgi:hypothetical protein
MDKGCMAVNLSYSEDFDTDKQISFGAASKIKVSGDLHTL